MIKSFIKIAVSIALLAVLLHYVDVDAVLMRLRQVDVRWVVLASVLLFFGQVISAVRWTWLARGLGLMVRTSRKIRIYFLGMFLSLFLPSIIGGDVARGFLLAKGRKRAGWQAAASVILERINGVLALTALTSICMLMVDVPMHWLSLWLAGVAGLWLGMFTYPFWHRHLPGFLSRWRDLSLDQAVFISAWWKGLGLSVVFHFSVIGSTMTLGHAAGLDLSFAAYTVMVGVVALATALPISFNGFGVREAGYIGFVSYFGGNTEAAAVMAALWVIVLAIVAAPGAWVLWRMGGTAALRGEKKDLTD